MISVIITSYNEPKSIAKCIRCIANPKYSGIPKNFELIQISPDDATLEAGKAEAKKLKLGKKYIQLRDPVKGKPNALNMSLKKASGDIIILTDGDTYFKKNAVKHLLEPFENEEVGGVTGRPQAVNSKDTFFGYVGNVLADSGHHRRTELFENYGKYFISGKTFFPMSGYIMAVRNKFKKVAKDTLADDAYISYSIRNAGLEIAYNPNAKVMVKYSDNLHDYLKQKVRSLGGYYQLKKYDIFKRDKQSRNFFIELRYAFFVLFYPKTLKEFYFSLLMFPLRLYTWFSILIKRVILREGMPKIGWDQSISTK